MSKRTEYELQIAIGGKVDNSLTKSVNEIKGQLGSMGGTIKTVATAAATVFASVKIKDIFDEVTDASKEFETSMAGVAKVVDGLKDDNGKVTQSYYDMKDAIIDMSKDLPMTAENIAAIVEAAGQSNIAKDELLDFTETASKMGIAFDSTAEQAGEWMAAWRTALDLDQTQVTDLADQINYLGNTSSEDAGKLSEVVTRVGSLSKTSGIAASSVAAIAASMTKVPADVAATGIKNFATALVSGESATKRQIKAYDSLGLKAKDVAKAMQTDSKGTMLDVLERINKLSKDKRTSTMKDLFGSESLSSIAPLAANLNNLKKQFKKVEDPSLYSGSMEKEYTAASSTASNVDVLSENKIQAAKIQIGDSLVSLSTLAAETKGNLAESFGDFVQSHSPEIQDAARDIKQAFSKFLPTAVTELKTFSRNAIDTIEPVYDLIKDNPEIIPDFIVSVGSAMVTYKVGKNIGEIVKNAKLAGSPLKLLSGIITNPWALAIGAVAGGIAMIATSVYNAQKELREADLASRFGDITLSLEDLDEIAADIIRDDNFSKLSDSMKAGENIDNLKDSIDDTMADLKRFNWKVSIGLDLTKDEQSQYQAKISDFISESQNLLLEERYKLKINMELFSDGSAASKNIESKMNAFYNNNYKTLSQLGKELQKEVNKAFSDGLLTIDESKVIADYMQQMADLNKDLAAAEFDAKMTAMGTEYTGTGLTPESFANLQTALNEQVEETKKTYTESLAETLQSYKATYDKGGLTKDEYNTAVTTAKEEYTKDIGELQAKSFDFQYQTITSAYADVLDKAGPEFEKLLADSVDETMSNVSQNGLWGKELPFLYEKLFDYDGISKTEKANLKKLYESLIPSQESMEEIREYYIQNGMKIPDSLSQGLLDSAALGSLAGNADSILVMVGNQISESPEYERLINNAYDSGVNIDLKIIEGMRYKIPAIDETADNMLKIAATRLKKGLDVELPVNVSLKSNTKNISQSLFSHWNTGLLGHKDGGIFSQPHIAWFAEDGPEAAIPIDGSNNAFELWYATGQMLGAIDHNMKDTSSLLNDLSTLPGHKDGGIFDKPHIAWFAEDGPEAAIPLDGSSEAVNLWYMAGQILGMIDRDKSYGTGFSIPEAYNAIAGNSTINNVNNNESVNNQPEIKIENKIYVQSGADVKKVQQAITMSQSQFDNMMDVYTKKKGRVSMG